MHYYQTYELVIIGHEITEKMFEDPPFLGPKISRTVTGTNSEWTNSERGICCFFWDKFGFCLGKNSEK